MEISNETLALWADMVQQEVTRRRLNLDVVPVHPGNVEQGKPLPHVVRVLKKLTGLPPADLAKLETLMDGWTAARERTA